MERVNPRDKIWHCVSMKALTLHCAAALHAISLVLAAVPLMARAQESQPLFSPVSQAETNGFQDYLLSLSGKAATMGIRPSTLDAFARTLSVNPKVIRLDQAQPGGSFDSPITPFEPYRRQHVTPSLIERGRAEWIANRAMLERIEQETGVPEAVMVAIYGHETSYGSFTGDFDLLRSLATLAYEGRRRALFEPEFLAALKLVDSGIAREKLVGSWAGATGYPQFLPSVYLRVARDGDGDGKADIWASEADALASIAQYFVDAGWRKGQPWGMAVSVPAGLARATITNRTTPPRCPRVFERFSRWMSVGEWRRLGVVPLSSPTLADNMLAVLLEPDGPDSTAYLLTSNYQAILDYNCSNFYALSVGLLADAVVR